MSFADLEAKVNNAVFGKLSNAMATPSVGDPFPVVFDAAQGMVSSDGYVTREPSLEMQPAEHPSLAEGDSLTINSVGYKVRAILPLDEGGRQRVALVEV
jgi:hypothetical protein